MGIFVRLFWTFTVFIHSGHSFEFDSGNVNDAVDALEQELQQALSAAEFPFQAEAVSGFTTVAVADGEVEQQQQQQDYFRSSDVFSEAEHFAASLRSDAESPTAPPSDAFGHPSDGLLMMTVEEECRLWQELATASDLPTETPVAAAIFFDEGGFDGHDCSSPTAGAKRPRSQVDASFEPTVTAGGGSDGSSPNSLINWTMNTCACASDSVANLQARLLEKYWASTGCASSQIDWHRVSVVHGWPKEVRFYRPENLSAYEAALVLESIDAVTFGPVSSSSQSSARDLFPVKRELKRSLESLMHAILPPSSSSSASINWTLLKQEFPDDDFCITAPDSTFWTERDCQVLEMAVARLRQKLFTSVAAAAATAVKFVPRLTSMRGIVISAILEKFQQVFKRTCTRFNWAQVVVTRWPKYVAFLYAFHWTDEDICILYRHLDDIEFHRRLGKLSSADQETRLQAKKALIAAFGRQKAAATDAAAEVNSSAIVPWESIKAFDPSFRIISPSQRYWTSEDCDRIQMFVYKYNKSVASVVFPADVGQLHFMAETQQPKRARPERRRRMISDDSSPTAAMATSPSASKVKRRLAKALVKRSPLEDGRQRIKNAFLDLYRQAVGLPAVAAIDWSSSNSVVEIDGLPEEVCFCRPEDLSPFEVELVLGALDQITFRLVQNRSEAAASSLSYKESLQEALGALMMSLVHQVSPKWFLIKAEFPAFRITSPDIQLWNSKDCETLCAIINAFNAKIEAAKAAGDPFIPRISSMKSRVLDVLKEKFFQPFSLSLVACNWSHVQVRNWPAYVTFLEPGCWSEEAIFILHKHIDQIDLVSRQCPSSTATLGLQSQRKNDLLVALRRTNGQHSPTNFNRIPWEMIKAFDPHFRLTSSRFRTWTDEDCDRIQAFIDSLKAQLG